MSYKELADLHKVPYPNTCKSLFLNGFKLPELDAKYMHLVWVERFVGDSDYIYTLCNYYQGKAYDVMNNKEVNLQHCAIYVAFYENCFIGFGICFEQKQSYITNGIKKCKIINGNFAQAAAELYIKTK